MNLAIISLFTFHFSRFDKGWYLGIWSMKYKYVCMIWFHSGLLIQLNLARHCRVSNWFIDKSIDHSSWNLALSFCFSLFNKSWYGSVLVLVLVLVLVSISISISIRRVQGFPRRYKRIENSRQDRPSLMWNIQSFIDNNFGSVEIGIEIEILLLLLF
jgi:hypothetical protein